MSFAVGTRRLLIAGSGLYWAASGVEAYQAFRRAGPTTPARARIRELSDAELLGLITEMKANGWTAVADTLGMFAAAYLATAVLVLLTWWVVRSYRPPAP